MASPVEMMMKQVFKALGVDPEQVMKTIDGIRVTIEQIGSAIGAILNNTLMANRRLARIEAHLGLSDIEPLPQNMVISHVEINATVVGTADASADAR